MRCPTLLLPSESSDPLLEERMARKRAAVEEAVSRLPDCTVRWVPDSVHDVQLHQPGVVAEALRGFLGKSWNHSTQIQHAEPPKYHGSRSHDRIDGNITP